MLETGRSQVAQARAVAPPLTIRRVDAIPVALPLRRPMTMAGITITKAENLLVRIEAADGLVGWGEAASAPTMTGDTLGGLVAAVRDHLAPMLVGQDALAHASLVPALRRALIGNTGAHSAIEMALLDLVGHATKQRLIDIVAGQRRGTVRPMWLLGNATPEDDIAEAAVRQAEGFAFFKLKIGTKPVKTEIATALAVRQALGPRMPLCADANGGLTAADARRYIDGTQDAKLAFVEQPLPADDLAGLKRLARASKVPIGIDEGLHALADIDTNAGAGARGVSLKLIKLGGMSIALAAAKRCKRLGLEINVAAKIAESTVASAAAIHLACAVPNVAWGVSLTHFYLAEDIVRAPLAIRDGMVALPGGPGLGIEIDEAAVERLRVKTLSS